LTRHIRQVVQELVFRQDPLFDAVPFHLGVDAEGLEEGRRRRDLFSAFVRFQ
jgi:hypothetical protein